MFSSPMEDKQLGSLENASCLKWMNSGTAFPVSSLMKLRSPSREAGTVMILAAYALEK
jgi:hypothetical protein